MTDRPDRSKPAVAAKIMVTGASVTSVLGMTAAMGSASISDGADDSIPIVAGVLVADPTGNSPQIAVVSTDSVTSVIPPVGALALPESSVPVVGEFVPAPEFRATGPAPTIATPSAPAPESSPVESPVDMSTSQETVAPAPPPETVVVTIPAPIVVEVPKPAPAPDVSTSKSN